MKTASKKDVHKKFEEYMKELYKSPTNEKPTHIAICKEAGIDRNFYYRVKGDGFHGGIPQSKHVTALCKAIASKESLKKPVTAQKVLECLIDEGLLPKGSMLEPEVKESENEEQEVLLQAMNKINVIQEDRKVKFDEDARLVFEEMQDSINVLTALDNFRKDARNKSSKDFGSWK